MIIKMSEIRGKRLHDYHPVKEDKVVESSDIRDKFLLQHGKRVHEVKEIKVGDILGIACPKREDVQLNYVDFVSYKPDFKKFDYFPYAKLKEPHFGFSISNEGFSTGFYYLHIGPESHRREWIPLIISSELSSEQQEMQRKFLEEELLSFNEEFPSDEIFEDKKKRVYIMNEGLYRDLGNLIPLVELPSFSFLPQSRNLDELVKMLEESKGDIELARNASDNLKRIFKSPF